MARIAAIDGNGASKVLVLHGWALDSSVWLKTRALSDVSRFTWAYADFPGYGVNAGSTFADGLDGMARFALEAADELGWESFSVVGHSMGGATALRVASLAPERITNVVAVTPVSPAGTPFDEATYAAFDGAWSDVGAAIRGSLSPILTDSDLAVLVQRNRATMTQSVWSKYFANWSSSPSFMNEVSNYKGPTSILWGEKDPFVTPAYLEDTIAHVVDGQNEPIAESAHYPMVEHPDTLIGLVQRILGSRTSESSRDLSSSGVRA